MDSTDGDQSYTHDSSSGSTSTSSSSSSSARGSSELVKLSPPLPPLLATQDSAHLSMISSTPNGLTNRWRGHSVGMAALSSSRGVSPDPSRPTARQLSSSSSTSLSSTSSSSLSPSSSEYTTSSSSSLSTSSSSSLSTSSSSSQRSASASLQRVVVPTSPHLPSHVLGRSRVVAGDQLPGSTGGGREEKEEALKDVKRSTMRAEVDAVALSTAAKRERGHSPASRMPPVIQEEAEGEAAAVTVAPPVHTKRKLENSNRRRSAKTKDGQREVSLSSPSSSSSPSCFSSASSASYKASESVNGQKDSRCTSDGRDEPGDDSSSNNYTSSWPDEASAIHPCGACLDTELDDVEGEDVVYIYINGLRSAVPRAEPFIVSRNLFLGGDSVLHSSGGPVLLQDCTDAVRTVAARPQTRARLIAAVEKAIAQKRVMALEYDRVRKHSERWLAAHKKGGKFAMYYSKTHGDYHEVLEVQQKAKKALTASAEAHRAAMAVLVAFPPPLPPNVLLLPSPSTGAVRVIPRHHYRLVKFIGEHLCLAGEVRVCDGGASLAAPGGMTAAVAAVSVKRGTPRVSGTMVERAATAAAVVKQARETAEEEEKKENTSLEGVRSWAAMELMGVALFLQENPDRTADDFFLLPTEQAAKFNARARRNLNLL